MIRRPGILLALGALLVGASGLRAQSIPSPYEFIERGQEAGVFAGYFAAGSDRFGIGPRSAPFLGARYAVTVSGPVALEAVLKAIPTTRDVVNPNRLPGDQIIEESEVLLGFAEARLRIGLTGNRTWNGLQPFALLGIGLATDLAGQQAEDLQLSEEFRFDFGTKFTGSFGGGVRWILNDRFHARIDLAAQLYQIDNPSGFRTPELDPDGFVPEGQWTTSQAISLGFAIRF